MRPGDPWSGDMAFPGGRLHPSDPSARETAIRETREETGLDLFQQGRYLGRLKDLLTRHHSRWLPMVVSPYVFEWRGAVRPRLNHEVDALVWISLWHLSDPGNRGVRLWKRPLATLRMPSIQHGRDVIWGLSFSMLEDYLEGGPEP